ncbi:DUF4189 domain-containing protein [Pseudoxanthomonas sp. JBR18]|uniref:DUF4189 domain-containing protein n=1 Tax=Pseudoxanthomonas sp. JBR18 TaxID=2969308 RepID=UPI002306840E|nr:DUF4189 domain-containing protein [Pseudoxanthomonas sp. JBR18]WCE04601.1 DUF4189 domain-containing protein [Pseudoxanthomonas sp. JBR18]
MRRIKKENFNQLGFNVSGIFKFAFFATFGMSSVFFAGASFAQTRCPPGSAIGSGQCAPDDVDSSDQGPVTVVRYTGYWTKTWGALANGENGIGGVSVDFEKKRDAKLSAIKNCEDRGGTKCKVVITYYDQCVVATFPKNGVPGKSSGRTNTAATIEEATQDGLQSCSELNGGVPCEVVYQACTQRKYIKY